MYSPSFDHDRHRALGLLSQAIEQTPEAVFIVKLSESDFLTPDVVYANAAAKELTGYDTLVELAQAAETIHAGGVAEGESTFYHRSGRRFLGQYRSHPIDVPERHAVIVIKDITEERRVQRQLEMLSVAIEEAGELLVVVDDTPVSDGGPCIVYANRAFYDVTGYSEAEVLGLRYRSLYSPENPPEALEALDENIRKGLPNFREMLVRRKDGTDFWFEFTAKPFIDPETQRTFRLAVGRDITARRRALSQTALVFSALEQATDAIALYERQPDGSLEMTYENSASQRIGRARLLELWEARTDGARAIRERLDRGEQVQEVFAEIDRQAQPQLVQFSARVVKNAARVEAIMTVERVVARFDNDHGDGHALLLKVSGMLPALVRVESTDERLAILRAILLAAFGAEVHEDASMPAHAGVNVSTVRKSASFVLGTTRYVAAWMKELDGLALTALRLCIEAALEEEARARR